MPILELSTLVRGDMRTIYEIVKHPEHFPEFMPDVEEVLVLERGPGMQLTEWHALLDEAPVEWREEDRYEDESMQFWFSGFEGDFDKWDGEWRMEEEGDFVRVTLKLDYYFDLPTLQDLLMPVIQRKMTANVESMLNGLRERAEAEKSPRAEAAG